MSELELELFERVTRLEERNEARGIVIVVLVLIGLLAYALMDSGYLKLPGSNG